MCGSIIKANTYEVGVVLMDVSEVVLPESDVEVASAVDVLDGDRGAVDVGELVIEPTEDIEREGELTGAAVVESVRVRESDECDRVSEFVRGDEETEVEGVVRDGEVVGAVLELDTGRENKQFSVRSEMGW